MRFNHKLNLASGSPRRRELVAYLFNNTEILKTSCDEPKWQKGQDPMDYLSLCVKTKWRAAQKSYAELHCQPEEMLLVADTIVVLGKQVLGKPESPKQAREYLKQLSGKTHEVWTGFCVGYGDSSGGFAIHEQNVRSQVTFRTLSSKEIAAYVSTKEPMDKAGAYGFQGIGIQNIKKVEGSYTNIVGLPLFELQKAVQQILAKRPK